MAPMGSKVSSPKPIGLMIVWQDTQRASDVRIESDSRLVRPSPGSGIGTESMIDLSGGGGRSTQSIFLRTHLARKTSEVFSVDEVAVRNVPWLMTPPRVVPVV